MTTRREWLLALAAGALGAPLAGCVQQKVRRIGYLASEPDPRTSSPTFKSLMTGLQELGWIEGRNIEMRIRASEGEAESFPQLAAEIVREKVDVIVTGGSAATHAAKAATATIPIVFASATDPVGQKLVASLAQPGGNVTGLVLVVQELGPKRLQLLKEMLPRAVRVVRLFQASSIVPIQPAIINEEDWGARQLGVALQHVAVTNMVSTQAAIAAAAHNRADAVILTGAGLFISNRKTIASAALAHHLPTMCADRRFVEGGALASYGDNVVSRYRRVAWFVDRILRGGRPAAIPVESREDFELVVNLRTAQTLGITIPATVLLRAVTLGG